MPPIEYMAAFGKFRRPIKGREQQDVFEWIEHYFPKNQEIRSSSLERDESYYNAPGIVVIWRLFVWNTKFDHLAFKKYGGHRWRVKIEKPTFEDRVKEAAGEFRRG